jgi:hypothetical protein
MTNEYSCPSEFALERWRFGELAATPEEAPLITHVKSCPACRRRHAELAASEPLPCVSETIWAKALAAGTVEPTFPGTRRKLTWSRWLGAVLASAALAAVLVVVLRRPVPDTLAKGGDWQLGVIAKTRDGSLLRLDPGAPLSPGDRLRFEVFTTWPKADIALVMLDGAGKVSQLAPAEGRSLAISGSQRILLKEAVELDGSLGAERIVLVGCKGSLQVKDVVASAQGALTAAHGNPRQVGSLGTGCHEETFWITKVSR